ncbi:MAG TPA: polya polymerase [Lachnospiraceae bacterium]|nr:polya polymerase [Lachnospiraceae bacterium]
MKIKNVKDIEGFFKVVESCSGKVELVTDEGDRLNLKSKLSQYVSLAKVFSDDMIPEMELVVYDPDDAIKFVNFMAGGAVK